MAIRIEHVGDVVVAVAERMHERHLDIPQVRQHFAALKRGGSVMRPSRLAFLAISLATATLHGPPAAVAQCTGDEARPNVVGIWEWVHTDGGFAYQIITPDSIGYTVQLEFSETDLREYRDNVLVRTTGYTLVQESAGWTIVLGADSAFPHPPFDYPIEFFCVVTPESPEALLRAIDNCADCYSSTYAARGPVPVTGLSWGDVKRLYRKPE
jgi:hypothetical protein